MAITIDQASIGTPVGLGTSSGTVAITTNVTVAAGALIVLEAFGDPPATTAAWTASGGGLTWQTDKQGSGTAGDCVGQFSAPAPAGLASGTTLTVTYDQATSSRMLGGMSILGADLTGSRVDGTPSENDQTGRNWASASMTLAGGSILVGGQVWDLNTSTSAPSGGTTEAWEKNEATGGNAITQVYRIEAVGGSFTVAGQWTPDSSATTGTTIAVAYKAAAAAGSSPKPTPLPIMSNGRI